MNAKILLSLQLASLIIMLGTAELLFVKTVPTILFVTSLAIFFKCSIYISKHEKSLRYDMENRQKAS